MDERLLLPPDALDDFDVTLQHVPGYPMPPEVFALLERRHPELARFVADLPPDRQVCRIIPGSRRSTVIWPMVSNADFDGSDYGPNHNRLMKVIEGDLREASAILAAEEKTAMGKADDTRRPYTGGFKPGDRFVINPKKFFAADGVRVSSLYKDPDADEAVVTVKSRETHYARLELDDGMPVTVDIDDATERGLMWEVT